MNKVIDAVKTVGVKENETSTSSFSISPNYNYSQPSDTTTGNIITEFTVSNSIQIQSTNIGNVSKWIDTAIARDSLCNTIKYNKTNRTSAHSQWYLQTSLAWSCNG